MSGPEDYALSKDVDVALWMDSRAFHGQPPLTDALDLVIVNCQIHNEFDSFKKSQINPACSYIAINELLKLYCHDKCHPLLSVQKFGKSYLSMSGEQIDSLVEWVCRIREKYSAEGSSIFDSYPRESERELNPVLSPGMKIPEIST